MNETSPAAVLEEVRARLRSVPGLEAGHGAIRLAWAEGTLEVEGEVDGVATKKQALRAAASVPEVKAVVDRLRVRPAEPMGDRAIRDHVVHAFLAEPAFAELALFERRGDRLDPIRASPIDVRGRLEIEVADGVVTLDGTVPGLDHKRLAGLLAWWVPGVRDVVNGIAVDPPEEDQDGAIADACRIALEKDPFIDASQVRVTVRDRRVTLDGVVPSEDQRRMAEADVWALFGVDEVDNRILVHR
ncbi:MAG: BON domain-containing protein [Geminicoccaceae bacterium]|nr:BON domain-containing protein [Geminicoccaceae bacterium]MCX7630857.1 BON domain-containing protein [Geminicoccaceae bacterium]MDW8369085.1 BON domain-containing protein [Geminicoccaceae bacterium]